MEKETQKSLFESDRADTNIVLLYALGDFQNRGFKLIGRKLPLDRLLGAFKRAFEIYGIDELSDDQIAQALNNLGARVEKVPSFVARHPYRITVYQELADKCLEIYKLKEKEN